MSEDTSTTITDRCFGANMRVERIVHLATMVVESIDDDLYDWLTDDCESLLVDVLELEQHGVTFTELLERFGDRRDARHESLREVIVHSMPGWIVEVAQPVLQSNGDGKGVSLSWGHYQAKAFYGRTYEEALNKGLEWGERRLDEAMGESRT